MYGNRVRPAQAGKRRLAVTSYSPSALGKRPASEGRCSGGQAVQTADEGGRVDLQDRGDQHDIEHREVALAALYRADICAM